MSIHRKLVSVQRIIDLRPIEDADVIEQAIVLGWSLVVKKGEFAVGCLCCFFEIDSILPDGPEWSEFMRPRKFRVCTMRMRGCLSQGLALPLNIIPGFRPSLLLDSLKEGDEITETLGVVQHIPRSLGLGAENVIGSFSHRVSKTDAMRLQSEPWLLDEVLKNPFVVTVKLDGSSATYVKHEDGTFQVFSRNSEIEEGSGWYWHIAKRHNLKERMVPGTCIQGEVCGPGVQKNRMNIPELRLYVFDYIVLNEGPPKYSGPLQIRDLVEPLGLDTVPIDWITMGKQPATVDDFIRLANGTYEGTENPREGIVVRPVVPVFSHKLGHNLSFKVHSQNFLLKAGKE